MGEVGIRGKQVRRYYEKIGREERKKNDTRKKGFGGKEKNFEWKRIKNDRIWQG